MREIDEDERRDAIEERRRRRRAWQCACGLDGYPGTCPGAAHCPYADRDDEDEGESE
jgi:hypothetical protein